MANPKPIDAKSLLERPLTSQDIEFLSTAPELAVYLTISGVMDIARDTVRDSGGSLTAEGAQKAMQTVFAALDIAVAFTIRFDIVLPCVSETTYSTSFWRWFNWWRDYYATLSDENRTFLARAIPERKYHLVEKYRPHGDWSDYRSDIRFNVEYS